MKHTPENINKLDSDQIFVFGSNLAGRHGAGAAKVARELFGAEYGIGEGLTGQSYAFPTLTENFQKVSEFDLLESIENFYHCCESNLDKQFILTKVGCGLAGFTENYMIECFNKYKKPINLILPEGW